MPLRLFNTLTRRKEEFLPIETGKVRMYVCGITAYDECHLGHARAAITFDLIYRYLLYRGFQVNYVRNYTDVDDKIIKKANELGLSCEEVSERYIRSYMEAMKRLDVLTPTSEPRASQHIDQMIRLIQSLQEKGYAYQAGRDVIYRVRKFPDYGKLSHKKIDELEAGARVEVDEKKEDPLDFVLWKGAKPGEPKWPSPWGEGRPGWHIECSAMSMEYLGESFDIHGGGRDLIFPHHENEIAQSEAATERPFVRRWIHNGFVNIEEEKMSKSLGNIRTIAGMLQRWPAEAVRLFLLTSHYRSPINFTEKNLDEAEEALVRVYGTLRRLGDLPEGASPLPDHHLQSTFEKEMDDDFNAAKFLGGVFDRVRRLNAWLDSHSEVEPNSRSQFIEELRRVSDVLGLFGEEPRSYLETRKQQRLTEIPLSQTEIEARIQARYQARSAKDWQRADQIRAELASHGIELKDNPDGTTSWTVRTR